MTYNPAPHVAGGQCGTRHCQGVQVSVSTLWVQQLWAYLEVEGYPLDGAAVRVLLGERIVQGGQAAPLLLRPAPLRVWLQLQRCPQAIVVLVVVGVQRQQPPASMQRKR
jgi:hypothetical protein